ncbi:eukaryotic elongation factor-1 B beta [Tribonema minus]|uniref:Eukaryotic elongation factor-1 B beta n=1 Tax=Tribonema minus TaxID=303371 RepID=A0A835YW42_9STRA|nr:eukaryotic elongation factor-1 B beta [Tribonema minus]
MAGQKFDPTNAKGLGALNGFLASRSYMEGYAYSAADSALFAACNGAPDKATYPHAYRWYIHVAALTGLRSLNLSAAAPAAAAPAAAAKAAPAAKMEEEEDDEIDFGDDDEEAAAPAAKGPSRAEQMAAAKASKEKKKKIEMSNVVYEVKPWEADQDLKALYEKIKEKCAMDGLRWSEGCTLAPVAFGINKLVIACTIEDDKVGLNDISDMIEALEDDVQSVDLVNMQRCS